MKHSLVYGPVPSRRLGLSLGVDLVPFKKCPFDCIYCQIGRTPQTTMEQKSYVPSERIIEALEQKFSSGLMADYITLGGSGEPTLNSDIGIIIREIKKITSIPVAVLTNGALLWKKTVQEALIAADVVLPSLDAPDEKTFIKINRPHPEISFTSMVDGMAAFRRDFRGKIWLEIFFIEGLNTSKEHIAGFRKQIEKINPDRIHLNTAIRPTAEPSVLQVSEERLHELAVQLGDRAEIIAEYPVNRSGVGQRSWNEEMEEEIYQMITRRPCTISDIASGLEASESEIVKILEKLVKNNTARIEKSGVKTYYSGEL